MINIYAKTNDDKETAQINVDMDGRLEDIFFEAQNAMYTVLNHLHKQSGIPLEYFIQQFLVNINDMYEERGEE